MDLYRKSSIERLDRILLVLVKIRRLPLAEYWHFHLTRCLRNFWIKLSQEGDEMMASDLWLCVPETPLWNCCALSLPLPPFYSITAINKRGKADHRASNLSTFGRKPLGKPFANVDSSNFKTYYFVHVLHLSPIPTSESVRVLQFTNTGSPSLFDLDPFRASLQ